MKLHELRETLSHEDHQAFSQWQRDCRAANENCTFTGSAHGGCQAVDWISMGNPVVGDWDGKTKTGQVYPQRQTATKR